MTIFLQTEIPGSELVIFPGSFFCIPFALFCLNFSAFSCCSDLGKQTPESNCLNLIFIYNLSSVELQHITYPFQPCFPICKMGIRAMSPEDKLRLGGGRDIPARSLQVSIVQPPSFPGALIAHRVPMSLLVKVSVFLGRGPVSHLTCHSRRWPQSRWKWCKARLCPCCVGGGGIWLRSISPEGEETPASPSPLPPSPRHFPPMYPETLQQLLTGPEPDLSGGAGVDPGYKKSKIKPQHFPAFWPPL